MATNKKIIAQNLLMDLIMSNDDNRSCNPYILNIGIDVAKTLKNVSNSGDEAEGEKLSVIDELEQAIIFRRAEKRSVSDKRILIYSYLDRMESSLFIGDRVKDYFLLCKNNYSVWDVMEGESKRNILIAEYLFSVLQDQEKDDYVIVVLELSRAMENELNQKVFNRYIDDLVKRKKKIDKFLSEDKVNKELFECTKNFVAQIERKVFFSTIYMMSLEQIKSIFSCLSESRLVEDSPLLKDFYGYLKKHSLDKYFLDCGFIDGLGKMASKFGSLNSYPAAITFTETKELKDGFPDRFSFINEVLR